MHLGGFRHKAFVFCYRFGLAAALVMVGIDILGTMQGISMGEIESWPSREIMKTIFLVSCGFGMALAGEIIPRKLPDNGNNKEL